MTRQTSILIRIYATPDEAQLIEDTLDTRARTEALLGAIPQEDRKMAKVVYKNGDITPNGREGRFELRAGAKGTGKLIGAVNYWPWSERSVEEAEKIIRNMGDSAGVEIDWGSEDDF